MPRQTPAAPILVIGVGNPARQDDSIGPAVARLAREALPPGVKVIEHGGDGMALKELWKSAHAVFVIDAADHDSEPGTIHRFNAAAAPLPSCAIHRSTHAFGLA